MKNKLKYIPIAILTFTTAFAGLLLLSPYVGAATESKSLEAVVTVEETCAFDSDYSYTSAFTAGNGIADDTESDTSKPEVQITCNTINGSEVQAVGFSPDDSHASGNEGNTFMYSGSDTGPKILTGSGDTTDTFSASDPSFWGMRISSAEATTSSGTTTLTPESPFNTADHNYVSVPSAATTVVTYPGDTTGLVTGTMRADYGFYVSLTQPSGTYVGKVKYTIVAN